MNESTRKGLILKLLTKEKIVRIAYLRTLFNVSHETIRRDLAELESDGVLRRVHGGAILENMRGMEIEFTDRYSKNQKEKNAIGKEAAKLIQDNDTIIINSGTTTSSLAQNLLQKKNLTVLTNSIQIAQIMIQNKNCRIFFIGGELRSPDLSTSGYLTHEFMGHFKVDKAILGIGGIDATHGITDYHIEESFTWRTMVEISRTSIFLADYSKFGICALNQICKTEDITWIVTDWNTPSSQLVDFRNQGIGIVVATQ